MEQRYDRDEIEIDLKQLFFVLLDKIRIILLSGLILALAAFLATKLLMTPIYTSTSSVYVLNRQNSQSTATNSDISAATSLTKDYEKMVTSRTVMEQVIDRLGLDMTAEHLASSISVNNDTGTRILDITVGHENADMAKKIADAVAEISSVQIVELMGMEKVNIIDWGGIASHPSSPNVKRNMLLAGIIGVFLAAAVVIIIFLLDDTIKSADDVEKYLGLSVLGTIPKNDAEVKKGKSKKKKQAKGRR